MRYQAVMNDGPMCRIVTSVLHKTVHLTTMPSRSKSLTKIVAPGIRANEL